jgi:hypothetical protein
MNGVPPNFYACIDREACKASGAGLARSSLPALRLVPPPPGRFYYGMTARLKSHWWWDHSTKDFAEMDMANLVAILELYLDITRVSSPMEVVFRPREVPEYCAQCTKDIGLTFVTLTNNRVDQSQVVHHGLGM